MKNNLFFMAQEYKISKSVATKVAEFFSMRLFDSVEMFEFDNAPRKIDEVMTDFGRDYVKKEMRSIAKMQLDFDDAVFVADFRFLDAYKDIYAKIQSRNLVIFLSDKTQGVGSKEIVIEKLCFLSDCCDLAIDVSCLSNQEIFDKVILEIKKFYGLEE